MDQEKFAKKEVLSIGVGSASDSRPVSQLVKTFSNRWSPATLFRIFCLLVTVAFAGLLTLWQMTSTQMLKEERVRLERHWEGTAHKPFAYRILVPLGVRAIMEALPQTFVSSLEAWLKPPQSERLPQQLPPPVGWPTHHLLLASLLGASLLGYAAIIYLIYEGLFVSRWWYRALVPPLVLTGLIPFVSSGIGHVYDFTLLMFMGALLYAMVTHRHWLFLVLFAASCLNKETTVLMSVAYASYFYDRLPRRKFFFYVGVQWAIFALLYGYLRYHFQDNPGLGLELWGVWWDHRIDYFRWFNHIMWLTHRSFNDFVTALIIFALIVFHWRMKPLVLRRATAMVLPHLGLFLMGAASGEVRNLYESVPLLSLFVCRNLELLGDRCLGSRASSFARYERAS